MIVALNLFISKSADICKPFFQLLKKWKEFQWTKEYDDAFQSLKLYLDHPSILSNLELDEDLYLYLAVFEHAISAVLISVSKNLVDSKTRYLPLEKMVMALVHATRKQTH